MPKNPTTSFYLSKLLWRDRKVESVKNQSYFSRSYNLKKIHPYKKIFYIGKENTGMSHSA